MKCPYCNAEMERGYIQSRDGLGWSRKERVVKALSAFLSEVRLGNAVIAHRCGACKKIVIEEAEQEVFL